MHPTVSQRHPPSRCQTPQLPSIFSICQALLLRPLPFASPERLVWIANGSSDNLSEQTVQVSNLESLIEQNRTFDGIAGFSPFYGSGDAGITGSGDPARITAVPVTQTLFSLLGVSPLHGRFFDDAESATRVDPALALRGQ